LSCGDDCCNLLFSFGKLCMLFCIIEAIWSCVEFFFKSCDFDVSKYSADLVMELFNVGPIYNVARLIYYILF
jgi:hypothetical protein